MPSTFMYLLMFEAENDLWHDVGPHCHVRHTCYILNLKFGLAEQRLSTRCYD